MVANSMCHLFSTMGRVFLCMEKVQSKEMANMGLNLLSNICCFSCIV